MDLKEIKRITAFARKAGIKSLKFGDVAIEFGDHVPATRKRLKLVEEGSVPAPQAEPTLDQIYSHIYSGNEGVG